MKPDFAQTETFIRLLTGSAETAMCWQCYPERGGYGHKLTGRLSVVKDELARLNLTERRAVGVVINEGGFKKAEITRPRAFFIDGDGKLLPDIWHRAPTIVCFRDSFHWHAFWTISGWCQIEEWRATQRQLAKHYGTDTTLDDAPQIMRVPGFLHQKEDEPSMYHILERKHHGPSSKLHAR